MRNKALERALYGPSWFEITLGGILSLLLGVVLAVGFLVLKPVEVVKEKEMPKEEDRDPRIVYYVEGSRDYSKGRQWIRKRQLIIDGTPGEIVFTEDELNSWFSSNMPKDRLSLPPKPKADEKGGAQPQAEDKPFPDELITRYAANFRIRDNLMQASLPTMLNIPLVQVQLPLVVQSRGAFTKLGDVCVYQPREFYIGSFPLHRFLPFNEATLQKAVDRESGKLPEDVVAMWKKISDVTLDGRTVKLTIQ